MKHESTEKVNTNDPHALFMALAEALGMKLDGCGNGGNGVDHSAQVELPLATPERTDANPAPSVMGISPGYITTQEAARILGVHTSTMGDWAKVNRNNLDPVRAGAYPMGQLYWPEDKVKEYADKRRKGKGTPAAPPRKHKLMTTKEVATCFRVSTATVNNWGRHGTGPIKPAATLPYGKGSRYVWNNADIKALIG